jgi:hypothetical protein
MKILTLDIETRPHLAYIWDLWNQNIGLKQVKEFGRPICFAAKWLGEKDILYYSDFHDGHDTVIKEARDLFDEADVLVTYNGKTFDVPRLQGEMLAARLTPPSPVQHIDLYQIVKRKFKFASNKLDYYATRLDIGSKTPHSGFDLWIKCMEGDIDAWATMREYNQHDVVLTEELYTIVRPWIDSHPNLNAYSDEEIEGCTRCGSSNFHKRGLYVNNIGQYQRYQCQDCGGWMKNKMSDRLTDLRSV